MQELQVIVDYNGIVLFDPDLLQKYYNGNIVKGTNLYKRFTETEEGDEIVKRGIVIPILNINDSVYKVYVRKKSEQSIVDSLIIRQNGVFPLHVGSRLVIADLAVLVEWEMEENWQSVSICPGYYATVVRGFRNIEHGVVTGFGYEFVLAPETALPEMSASINENMQVLYLPNDEHELG